MDTARGIHRPGQEVRQHAWRLSAGIGAGVEISGEPGTRIDPPQRQGLQDGEQRRGELRAPQATRAVVILTPDDRRADRLLVIVHRHLGVRDKDRQPRPMAKQAGEHPLAPDAGELRQRGVVLRQQPFGLGVQVRQRGL